MANTTTNRNKPPRSQTSLTSWHRKFQDRQNQHRSQEMSMSDPSNPLRHRYHRKYADETSTNHHQHSTKTNQQRKVDGRNHHGSLAASQLFPRSMTRTIKGISWGSVFTWTSTLIHLALQQNACAQVYTHARRHMDTQGLASKKFAHTHTYRYAYGTDSGATRRPKKPKSWKVQESPTEPGGLQKKVRPKTQGEVDPTGWRRRAWLQLH